MGEPITLFGEDPADRRARLRQLLADLDDETLQKLDQSKAVQNEKSQIKDINLTTWYHEGSDDLTNARKFIAEYRYANKNFVIYSLIQEPRNPF